jgi:putative transposase
VTESYKEDDKCPEIMTKLLDKNVVPNYTLTSGDLRYKNKIYIVTTTKLRAKLLQSMRNSELGGHSGEKATYQRIKLLFAWPGLKNAILQFLKACLVCQINKPEHSAYLGLLPLPIPHFA